MKANVPPSVSMTAPANNSNYTAPAMINLAATATDTDGTIAKVEFYQGATRLATVTTAPYTYAWSNVAGGTYALTAKATDDKGALTTSAIVNVKVNKPPTVSITAPANNAVIVLPATVTINATASDADGTISKVEFYRDGILLGTDTASPYSYVWSNPAAGTYVLTAKATDNLGVVTTSAAVTITVKINQPPTVSITSPVNGAKFRRCDADDHRNCDRFRRYDQQGRVLRRRLVDLQRHDVAVQLRVDRRDRGRSYGDRDRNRQQGRGDLIRACHLQRNAEPVPWGHLDRPARRSVLHLAVRPPDIALAATASDSDGTIAAVRFYKQAEGLGGDPAPVLLGTVTAPPYKMTWKSVPYNDLPFHGNLDDYIVWAEATDNDGAVTASANVTIHVLQTAPPRHTLLKSA